MLEWTAAALSMQAIYTMGWVLAMLVVMWRGASWLWPDPLRRPWYGPIAMVCVAALSLWSVIAVRSDVLTTAVVGPLRQSSSGSLRTCCWRHGLPAADPRRGRSCAVTIAWPARFYWL